MYYIRKCFMSGRQVLLFLSSAPLPPNRALLKLLHYIPTAQAWDWRRNLFISSFLYLHRKIFNTNAQQDHKLANKQWQVVKADGFEKICGSPGSTIIEAPQGTGRRSGSSPYSRKAAADLTSCHKGRKEQAKLTHGMKISFPNCLCLSAEAQLNARSL